MPTSHLLAAVREFTTTILSPYDLQDLLHRLTDHATVITEAQGAGVMLAGENGLGFAAASNDEVIDVEVVQDRVDEGPCHDAFASDRLTAVKDVRNETQWPQYRDRAVELGFLSVLAVPMHARGQTIGTLDIYRKSAGPWADEDRDAAEIMTAMGAGYILHANQMRGQHELADQLQAALESRDVIGQAKGILMARHGMDAETAFDHLRTVSQKTNMKLRDVAARVVRDAMSGAS